jgi:UDP-N-acetyl-D-glucosamine dehydrogenase
MNIDVWEVIDAAATKPFGFTPYYPGPGIGGHCIPVDPLYLQWKARAFGAESQFIALSDQFNRSIPRLVADKVFDLVRLTEGDRSDAERARPPLIVIYGVAYKKDVNDVREAPALELIEILLSKGAAVAYHDPYVDQIEANGMQLTSVELSDALLQSADCVIILTDHTGIPVERIVKQAKLVVDTRNATAAVARHTGHVYRLGVGGGM